jgi:hypothetical protein
MKTMADMDITEAHLFPHIYSQHLPTLTYYFVRCRVFHRGVLKVVDSTLGIHLGMNCITILEPQSKIKPNAKSASQRDTNLVDFVGCSGQRPELAAFYAGSDWCSPGR